jgi:hypothetical protein
MSFAHDVVTMLRAEQGKADPVEEMGQHEEGEASDKTTIDRHRSMRSLGMAMDKSIGMDSSAAALT